MTASLAGRTALVTGGSGGIGLACAARLAADGAAVVLMARREAELAAARQRLLTDIPAATVEIAPGDALVPGEVERAMAAAAALGGGLDIVVATVGGSMGHRPLALHDEESFRAVLDRNLTSAFIAFRAAVPLMARGGSMVFISSVCASLPSTFLIPYCAAKAGLEAMVKGAAKECARLNIRVNAVRPGMTRAAGVATMFGERIMRERARELIPLGGPGDPRAVAEAVRYLAGSAWVTGQSFAVDGGSELALNRAVDDADAGLFGSGWPDPWSAPP
ncbi:SDR family NAD(P)-dependent oxidoreductase [Zavarzinia compransoris]|uniref:7-alpha-hydroxysteroid dehydrogenase n=1 Tax=Zavarzinia compransoris TaxID=1264899 RepID=A0A317DYS4_9PROT|nr:SDR family oxidoreductase [Zavarzinia compransoris]PWR19907.1 7-alpha-hydroxysteroid dehydrogenase [Zavarzinia compransoris]TDP44979.1 NAD(P)-dependent dehydrogenase (short-subunit alcohol dehydrogenase family) [Zavarzinia compransoris]